MRSGNPALKDSTFLDLNSGTVVRGAGTTMTLNGTVNKTAFLLVLTLAGALYTWNLFFASNGAANLMPYILVGALGGFVVAMVTIFKKTWAPVTAPLYAGLEGVFIGAISAMFELKFPGIVMQAVGLTFGTLAALLMAYRSGLIRATENFQQLSRNLSEIEDEIQASRRIYNSNVQAYNTKIQIFPNSIVANSGGFGAREFFEITDAAEREPVEVKF